MLGQFIDGMRSLQWFVIEGILVSHHNILFSTTQHKRQKLKKNRFLNRTFYNFSSIHDQNASSNFILPSIPTIYIPWLLQSIVTKTRLF